MKCVLVIIFFALHNIILPETTSNNIMESTHQDLTLLLNLNSSEESINKVLPIVYKELRKIASRYLGKEYSGRTLQTTELVHEAYLKLLGGHNISWQNRAHFFGIAASSMRQILVDYARKKKAAKRGGDFTRVSLSEGLMLINDDDDKMIAIDEALNKLTEFDERLSKIVEMRYFSGLTIEETAEVLNISVSTVKREWNVAKAWLFRELEKV